MKLITIMHLREWVNRKPLRARNSVFCGNVYGCLRNVMYYLPLHHWSVFYTDSMKSHSKQAQNDCYANF